MFIEKRVVVVVIVEVVKSHRRSSSSSTSINFRHIHCRPDDPVFVFFNSPMKKCFGGCRTPRLPTVFNICFFETGFQECLINGFLFQIILLLLRLFHCPPFFSTIPLSLHTECEVISDSICSNMSSYYANKEKPIFEAFLRFARELMIK